MSSTPEPRTKKRMEKDESIQNKKDNKGVVEKPASPIGGAVQSRVVNGDQLVVS